MDANELTSEGRAPLSLPGILWLGLISLAIYLSGLLVWLTPLPILYAYKYGRGVKGLWAALAPTLILAVLYWWVLPLSVDRLGAERTLTFFFWVPGMGLSPGDFSWNPAIFGISYYLFFALMGALLGEFESQPYTMTRLMGQTAGLLLLGLIVWSVCYTWGHWGDFVQGLEAHFEQLLREITKTQPANEEMQTQWGLLQEHAAGIAYYAVRLLPAMVVNMVLFVTWLNVVAARRLFGGLRPWFPSLGALKGWRLPFAGVWMVIVFAFLWIFDTYVLKVDWLKLAAMNAFIVFALVYFFQGLAIVAFYLNRWGLSPMIRLVLYSILILFFQPLSFLLVAFGFFDSWFNFRKLA
ncbi:MAG: DUF2232 domain-containing protein [bacterium]